MHVPVLLWLPERVLSPTTTTTTSYLKLSSPLIHHAHQCPPAQKPPSSHRRTTAKTGTRSLRWPLFSASQRPVSPRCRAAVPASTKHVQRSLVPTRPSSQWRWTLGSSQNSPSRATPTPPVISTWTTIQLIPRFANATRIKLLRTQNPLTPYKLSGLLLHSVRRALATRTSPLVRGRKMAVQREGSGGGWHVLRGERRSGIGEM